MIELQNHVGSLRATGQYTRAEALLSCAEERASFDEHPEELSRFVKEQTEEIEAKRGEYKKAIEIAAGRLVSQPSLSEPELEEIFGLVYELGGTTRLEEGIRILQEIENEYPELREGPLLLGAPFTDPLWLGLAPWRLRFIYSGDVRQIDHWVSEDEKSRLASLIHMYPNDPLSDWARIVIGDYATIVTKEPDSKVRDWALYKAGLEAYLRQNFKQSISFFQEFLMEYPEHRWADDAAYRIAKNYELLNMYDKALTWALRSGFTRMGDRDMETYSQLYSLALLDVYFSADDIADYLARFRNSLNSDEVFLLTFSHAEALFEEEKFTASRRAFESILRTNLADKETKRLVQHNIELLDHVLDLQQRFGQKYVLVFAKELIAYPEDLGTSHLYFYNDLYSSYYGQRHVAITYIGTAGPNLQYFMKANDHWHAAQMLERFIQSHNATYQEITYARYLETIAYYNLTFKTSFIFGHYFLPLKKKESETFRRLLDEQLSFIKQGLLQNAELFRTQYRDSPYAPEAISIAAIGFANMGDVGNAIKYMSAIVANFPNHHLANNALIFVARLYRKEARENKATSCRYLQQARDTYLEVLQRYPQGHVGKEAEEEVREVNEALVNCHDK